MLEIVRDPHVEQDLLEAAAYIALRSPATGYRFLEAAEDCFRQIATNPLDRIAR